MSGVFHSAGKFLGLEGGPEIQAQTANPGMDALNAYNGAWGNTGAEDARLTNGVTGTQAATDAVQSNPILGQMFGQGGQFGKDLALQSDQTDQMKSLQGQQYDLKPEDHTMYGQMSGNIARMFGSQGNDAAKSLASRGLASAPSGAAGAMFSGIQGNQNEMLANAQQQIAQQRFQNTQNQIAQQQKFIGQLQGANNANANLGAGAIQQQYGRQQAGAQLHQGSLLGAAGAQANQNNSANAGNKGAAEFNSANTPVNFMDGINKGMFNMAADAPKAGAKAIGLGG